MTFDFNYLTACDHTIRDRVFIEPDGRTIKVIYPMASTQVRLFRNGLEILRDHGVYGWVLIKDLEGASDIYVSEIATTAEEAKRSVRLNSESKVLDDTWEVLYITPLEFCRKCSGTKILNDWSLDQAGRLKVVVNEEKLAQDLRKLLITIKASHLEHAWYGSTLPVLVGSRFIAGLDIRLAAEIQEALERYVKVQTKQAFFQSLTPNEKIRELSGIKVSRGTGDNSDILLIEINIITDARTAADVLFGLSNTSLLRA